MLGALATGTQDTLRANVLPAAAPQRSHILGFDDYNSILKTNTAVGHEDATVGTTLRGQHHGDDVVGNDAVGMTSWG